MNEYGYEFTEDVTLGDFIDWIKLFLLWSEYEDNEK